MNAARWRRHNKYNGNSNQIGLKRCRRTESRGSKHKETMVVKSGFTHLNSPCCILVSKCQPVPYLFIWMYLIHNRDS